MSTDMANDNPLWIGEHSKIDCVINFRCRQIVDISVRDKMSRTHFFSNQQKDIITEFFL